MNLADGKPVEKAIATEKAPVANIGKCWGGGRDRCITFGLKNDGEGAGWSLERDRGKGALQILLTKLERKRLGPGLIRGLHLMQGLTGKGAGPAVRLATDGHFPREQDLAGRGLGVGT